MTYREAYDKGRKSIVSDEADTEAALLLEHVMNTERGDLFAHPDRILSDDEEKTYFGLIERRNTGEPVQYITGKTYLYGLEFFCDRSVLIPRFDTENLVDRVGKVIKEGDRVLDLCTGSGCIILSLKNRHPMIDAVASDISRAALLVAKENAKSYNMDVDFVRSDMFDKIRGQFDVIVSNPPYIRSAVIETLDREVKDFEPYEALDGREDGLFFYRRIAAEAKDHLVPNGHLALEIGDDQGEEVSDILLHEGYTPVDVYRDLNDKDRVIMARYEGES